MLPEGSVIGGFISKVINDVIDVSKHKIKEADKNRKSKSQNIQTRIYQVIIDAINELTNSRYKGQDELYDTAEILLNEFKSGNNNRIEGIRNSLRNLNPLIDNGTCERFIEVLRCEIEKEENFDLYKEILLVLLEDATKYNQSEHQQIKLQLEQINEKLDRNEKNRENQNISIHKKIKSRTQEYADKWNDNMFLNNFDKRDQRAGTNIKLSEVYLEEHLPHYIWKDNDEKEPSTDLKELLSEYINEKKDSQMLLVLGQPGIGKSTLITWITANFADRIDDILVYKFPSDLGKVDWKNNRVSNRILEELGLDYDDLNGKTLVLDGFDELSIEKSRRRDILDSLYGDWIYNGTIDNFSLIITCRENYVQRFAMLKCKYITLKPWSEMQIKSFCSIFQEKAKESISDGTLKKLLENKGILGIPLILYMVLALNISIEKDGSIVDAYDKIFSLEGGIYDRCIDNKKFAESHRIGDLKNQIHQISREIAIWMFENNPDKACILQEEYRNICNVIKNNMKKNSDIERDSLIGNFFKLKHCEGEDEEELYFVHRSIYEYFVVEYFFCSICEVIDLSKKELAGVLGRFLKGNILTQTMLEYLKIKIIKSKPKKIHHAVEAAFDLMLQDGMTYYTGLPYKNVICCEMNIFANMLEIEHLWRNTKWLHTNKYIKYNTNLKLNLKGVIFVKKGLTGVYLKLADLEMADMQDIILKRSDLRGANLKEANLNGADLSGADIRGADLKGAVLKNLILKGTIIDENQIDYLKAECDLQDTEVNLSDSNRIVKYEDYCKKTNVDASPIICGLNIHMDRKV